MTIVTIATIYLQVYVVKHLPLKDCLPYKVGNDILKLREMPADAVPDKYEYLFTYKKGAEQKDFTQDKIPDSTWTYVDRKQTLVQKGKNNVPLISDFSLTDSSGADVTESILSQPKEYYLMFIKDVSLIPTNWTEDQRVALVATQKGKQVYVVTADRKNVEERFYLGMEGKQVNIPIFTCDATALKTVSRNNITLYLMKGPIVLNKWGGEDITKAIEK
jgi:hypothetical protein